MLGTGVVALLGVAACSAGRRAEAGAGSPMSTEAGLPTGSSAHAIRFDDMSRSYRTYVPDDLDSSRAVPLVVMLHGGFGNAEQAEHDYGWDARADADSFVVVYPDGSGRAWNAGDCCGPPARNGVDDVGFVEQVVATVSRQAPIDPRRIFVTGMSNGAMLAYALICRTGVFAAAAPVAGAPMQPCTDPSPASLLHIHGVDDTSVPLDGSPGDGRGKVPAHTPIPEVIASWRRVDDCGEPSVTTDGPVTTSTATCVLGRAVTLVTVAGAGHQWPGSTKARPVMSRLLGIDPPSQAFDATGLIWSFFAEHPAPT